jgi:hypothetical protein
MRAAYAHPLSNQVSVFTSPPSRVIVAEASKTAEA